MAIKAPKVDSKVHEESILGMALIDDDSARAVAEIPEEIFYYSNHRSVLYGIRKLVKKKHKVDMLALHSELGNEFAMTIADIGNKGIDNGMLRQRINELCIIRFQHKMQNLPEDITPEEMSKLIDKYKPKMEEDRSYIPEKQDLLRKVIEFSKTGGLDTVDCGWPIIG